MKSEIKLFRECENQLEECMDDNFRLNAVTMSLKDTAKGYINHW